LFDYDELIKDTLLNPDQVWNRLDSFWRTETVVDTRDLVHYQTIASTLLFLNAHSKSNHLLTSRSAPSVEDFAKLPWFPIVMYEDQLIERSVVEYGDGYLYSPVPEINYGQPSGTPKYVYTLPGDLRYIVKVPCIVDAVINSSECIDHTLFTYDHTRTRLIFYIDPFTVFENKVSTDGRTYIVVWVRNIEIDYNIAFDQIGWVVKYNKFGNFEYAGGLQQIWDLVLRGPSISKYKIGLSDAVGLPYALSNGTIRRIEDDGYQYLISTDDKTYTALMADVTPSVIQGEEVVSGQTLTDGIDFLEYPDLLYVSPDRVPGLLLNIPLSTGETALISFANIRVSWEFVPGRPSEWRFPIGGDPTQVEQFWVDVDTFAVANGIDFATIYGLPGLVNPMMRIVDDLLHNSLFIAAIDLSIVHDLPGGFADRARLLLPTDVMIVLHQNIGAFSDDLDLGVTSSEIVGYGYNVDAPKEDISVLGSGTDLEYFDYTPLVVTW